MIQSYAAASTERFPCVCVNLGASILETPQGRGERFGSGPAGALALHIPAHTSCPIPSRRLQAHRISPSIRATLALVACGHDAQLARRSRDVKLLARLSA